MSTTFLSSLSTAERVSYPFLRRAIDEDYSAAEALSLWRRTGHSIATGTWYELWRGTEYLMERGAAAQTPPPARGPDYGALPSAPHKLLRRYSHEVELRGVSPREEDDEGFFVTVSSSRQLSYAEIEDAALQALSASAQGEIIGEVSAIIHRSTQAGPLGTRL